MSHCCLGLRIRRRRLQLSRKRSKVNGACVLCVRLLRGFCGCCVCIVCVCVLCVDVERERVCVGCTLCVRSMCCMCCECVCVIVCAFVCACFVFVCMRERESVCVRCVCCACVCVCVRVCLFHRSTDGVCPRICNFSPPASIFLNFQACFVTSAEFWIVYVIFLRDFFFHSCVSTFCKLQGEIAAFVSFICRLPNSNSTV